MPSQLGIKTALGGQNAAYLMTFKALKNPFQILQTILMITHRLLVLMNETRVIKTQAILPLKLVEQFYGPNLENCYSCQQLHELQQNYDGE